jgi:glycerate kinase
MKILIAPNAFKGSLKASEAANIIRDGIISSGFSGECILHPVADGGDGSLEVWSAQSEGEIVPVQTVNATGEPLKSQFGFSPKTREAFVELAAASGMAGLSGKKLDPWRASTKGTGIIIEKARESGAETVYLAVGGSATVDLGLGALKEMGLKLLDKKGNELNGNPSEAVNTTFLHTDELHSKYSSIRFVVLCDVFNKLMGENGAVRVFGPQKGLEDSDIDDFENFFEHMSNLIKNKTNVEISSSPHGGAAGGIAASFYGLLNAKLSPGASTLMEMTGFSEKIKRSDVVITGEGSLDSQTENGKAPFEVARQARKLKKFVVNISGSVPETPKAHLYDFYDVILSTSPGAVPLDSLIKNSEKHLFRTARQVGKFLSGNF